MMNSFIGTCRDLHLIERWVIGDDGSSDGDIERMQRDYPFLEIHRNPGIGQASNINNLFSRVHTEWFFNCEDDWLFLVKDNYIRKMFDVVYENENIKNVTLRNWYGGETRRTKRGTKYNIHKYDPDYDGEDKYKRNTGWYGYSLGVSLQHKPTVDLLGPYEQTCELYLRDWDKPQAKKYMDLGYKAANLPDKIYVNHIGQNNSVYKMRKAEHATLQGVRN